MTKKKFSTKKSDDKKKQPGISPLFRRLENNRYFPYALFILLALIYFAPLVFGNNTLFTTEKGYFGYGETGKGLQYSENPFRENRVWTPVLGGMPYSEALHEYTYQIFKSIFIVFFYDFKVKSLYLLFLSVIAGIGMMLFLREMGVRRSVAVALGAAYQFSPHFLSLTHAGHSSKMGVIAFLPLLFLFLNRGMKTGRFRYFLWFALFIGIDIFTAHLQMVHFSLLALGFYFLFELVSGFLRERSVRRAGMKTAFFILAVALGLGIGARGFLPQYIYTKTESKRSGQQGEGLTKDYATSWSLHAEEVASLAVPEFVHYDVQNVQNFYWGKNALKTNADYFGGIVFVLSFLALVFLRKSREALFFFGLFLFGILFALGSPSPVYEAMFHLVPGVKSFRAPSLMIFITAFSGFVLTGFFLQHLFSQKVRGMARKSAYVFFALAALCLLGAASPGVYLDPWKGIFYSGLAGAKLQIFQNNIPQLSAGFLASFLFFALFGAGLLLRAYDKLRVEYLIFALIPLFIIDFWRIDKDFLTYKPVTPGEDPTGMKKIPAYEYLKTLQGEQFRIMPLHINSLQNRFHYRGLNFVTGFHDFSVRRYDVITKVIMQNRNARLNNFINLTAGKYIVTPDLTAVQTIMNLEKKPAPVFAGGSLFVVKNGEALPYFYVRNHAVVQTGESQMLRTILMNSLDLNTDVIVEEAPPEPFSFMLEPDSQAVHYSIDVEAFELEQGNIRLTVQTDAPGFLVFSENYHPRDRDRRSPGELPLPGRVPRRRQARGNVLIHEPGNQPEQNVHVFLISADTYFTRRV